MTVSSSTLTLPTHIDTQVLFQQLSQELGARPAQVQAAIDLLDEGATVPFIARYRKEVTGGLDDTVLRELETRLAYLREFYERRLAILSSIQEQGKLTPELYQAIQNADSKQRLEDLYAPYKPKRRTRAQIAIEAGLEPLAGLLLNDAGIEPLLEAERFINAEKGVDSAKKALEGARDILSERFAEDADLIALLRDYLEAHAQLFSRVVPDKEAEGEKFQDWFAFSESLKTLPSHRILAMLRGRQQGVLYLNIGLPEELETQEPHPCLARMAQHLHLPLKTGAQASPRDAWIADVLRWTWRVKLLVRFETEFLTQLRERADTQAIQVFSMNLKDLLLAAPAGHKAVMGLDPGIRTGVKVAVIDPTGKLLDTATIYPFEPRRDIEGSLHTLTRLAQQHGVQLIAIGNGTASRETDKLVADWMRDNPQFSVHKVTVSEAGASVYSASELAAQEFPELDVSLRGAVSIARRLQDPLAELVKIEPKSIGVGQYQHDVNQRQLSQSLDAVVEDCVNAVGVDVNTASSALLSRVSGLSASLAHNIVTYRDTHGAFANRQSLLNVPRFGDKTFEQSAGFLRIVNGDNPLDASSVHPEAYPVVARILNTLGLPLPDVMGNTQVLKSLDAQQFTDDRFGLPTVKDILKELDKPGRDPRPEFTTASFRDDVHTLQDLKPGMILEGVVTNVTNFGAFVDIGVHQDGLVHISMLSHTFVKDARDVVHTGKIVKVKVMEVDIARKRISLSMRMDDEPGTHSQDLRSTRGGARSDGAHSAHPRSGAKKGSPRRDTRPTQAAAPATAMSLAFAKLKK